MGTAQLDTAQLSSYIALPQHSIDTLIDNPTNDLVRSLLESILVKAREHSELASEKLRLGVELENAVRGGESKSRVLKNTIDKGLKELVDLRQTLQSSGRCRWFQPSACLIRTCRDSQTVCGRGAPIFEGLDCEFNRGSICLKVSGCDP